MSVELAKLKWQCRRGALELDLLLMRYLDSSYMLAEEEEKMLFIKLLSFEDDVLVELLINGIDKPFSSMNFLVNKIRNT